MNEELDKINAKLAKEFATKKKMTENKLRDDLMSLAGLGETPFTKKVQELKAELEDYRQKNLKANGLDVNLEKEKRQERHSKSNMLEGRTRENEDSCFEPILMEKVKERKDPIQSVSNNRSQCSIGKVNREGRAAPKLSKRGNYLDEINEELDKINAKLAKDCATKKKTKEPKLMDDLMILAGSGEKPNAKKAKELKAELEDNRQKYLEALASKVDSEKKKFHGMKESFRTKVKQDKDREDMRRDEDSEVKQDREDDDLEEHSGDDDAESEESEEGEEEGDLKQ